jgi:glycosyltransferase involved in cell wall biosynthesis
VSRGLVIGGWPPSLVNFRGRLLEAMRERGHEVVACAGGEDDIVAARLQEMGVCYLPLPLERSALNPLRDLRLLWHLVRLMQRDRPDWILAYTVKPVIYGMLAARLAGVKRRYAMVTGLGYAFIASTSLKQRLLGWLVPRLYRAALDGAGAVFFQNNDDLNLFRQRGILQPDVRAIRIMGSGVDLAHFSPVALPQGPVVFLMMARLLADKGIREYVQAARVVRDSHPEARFALLGPFDPNPAAIAKAELQQWIDEGVVEYWGETNDVRPYLARCSVYVLPSYREGMPRSVLEAMAMGRPIITTDVPGCRDTVEEGVNGYLVPARDSEALANAMRRCLEPGAPLARMGQASRRRAEQYFSVESVNRTLLQVMDL